VALAARLSMALFENPVIQTEEEKEAYSLFLILSSDEGALKQETRVTNQKISVLESLRN
jgi:dsDNA-binding SOS-regulon protein